MTPAHVSSRYHQSLRNQLICKGIVVPTDDTKLMVFFLSKLGWSYGLEPVETSGMIRQSCTIRNLHKKGGLTRGVSAASSMPKSVSFLQKGKRSTVDGIVIAYLSSVEFLGIYRG